MTSSYSNMYLATYLALNLDKLDEITAEVEKLAVAGQHFLDDQFGEVQKIVDEFDYNRIVYLGNIGLKGVAQEVRTEDSGADCRQGRYHVDPSWASVTVPGHH